MKHLVIKFNLFTVSQHAFLEQDGEILDSFYFNLRDLTKTIFSIEGLDKVTFYGNKKYLEPFVEKIKIEEMQKYQKNSLNIEVKEK